METHFKSYKLKGNKNKNLSLNKNLNNKFIEWFNKSNNYHIYWDFCAVYQQNISKIVILGKIEINL